ncbi:hypothetical protein OC842_003367 [Tilletia horrida]|uniref:Knl1 C-terminal RWD domain-containing protein n=1 Tax=Tilletia horrida TaxID=155126 RepID=A0AAN6GCX7_9BASI|nr:hypothetical protein OC842_003367 [Tilletia horrida]
MPASPLRATQSPRQSMATASHPPPRNAPRKSAVRATPQVFASPSQVLADPSEGTAAFADDHTRKKRRVTFSRRQELTDYDREEPTVNIGRASEMPMPDTPSSTSNLTQSSIESESMSMDMSMTGVFNAPAPPQRTQPMPGSSSTGAFGSYRLSSPRRPSSGRVSNLSRVTSEEDEDSESESGSEEDESMSLDMSMTNVQNVRARTSLPRPPSAPASPSSVGSQSRMSMASPVRQPHSTSTSPARQARLSLASPSRQRVITADQLLDEEEDAINNSIRHDRSRSVASPRGSFNQSMQRPDEEPDFSDDDSEADVEKSIAVQENSAMELTDVHSDPAPPVVSRAELEKTLRETAAAESKNKHMREDWLPKLRALHAELKAKAEKEKARTEAIRSCDPDELANLHQAIEEQSAILSEFRQKKQRSADHLQRIQSRLDEVLVQKQNLLDAISAAREVYQSIQGCTRGEAARLLQEAGNVQKLHLWTAIHLPAATGKSQTSSGRVELLYDSALLLQAELVESGLHAARPSIVGGRFHAAGKMPALKNARVKLCKPEAAGPIQLFAIDVLDEVVQQLTSAACPATEVLRTISNLWLRQAQLQAEVDMLQARWPTTVTRTSAAASWNGLTLSTSLLLKRQRAKIRFVVGCSAAMLLGGAEGEEVAASSGLLEGQAGWEAHPTLVERVYGNVNAEAMAALASDSLERAGNKVGASARLVHTCEEMLAVFDA